MRPQKTRWRTSGQSKGRVANQGTVPGLQDWFRTSRKGFPESQRARSVFLLGLQDTTGDENKMMPTRNFSRTRHMEVRRRVSAVLSRHVVHEGNRNVYKLSVLDVHVYIIYCT